MDFRLESLVKLLRPAVLSPKQVEYRKRIRDWYEEYGWRVPPRQMPGGPILSSKRRVGESRRYRPDIGSVLNQIAFGASERAATMSGQPSSLKSANANPYTVPLPSFQGTS